MSARDRNAILETLSRRIVIGHLPTERFLERDQTERDYGVDLVVECFDPDASGGGSEPAGSYLLFQLKGTDGSAPDEKAPYVKFSMRVDQLKRAQRFATPVILVWCPVNDPANRCWFLWLQRYVDAVLDIDKPTWRGQKTVTLYLPIDNVLPTEDAFDRLAFIARHPMRAFEMGQLARLAHEARWEIEAPWHHESEDPNEPDWSTVRSLFEEALRRCPHVYRDPYNLWGHRQRAITEGGSYAAELLDRGVEPTRGETARLKILQSGTPLDAISESDDFADRSPDPWGTSLARAVVEFAARNLSMTPATYFDFGLHYTMWQFDGWHEF